MTNALKRARATYEKRFTSVLLRLPPDLAQAIDDKRGARSRAAYVLDMITSACGFPDQAMTKRQQGPPPQE